MTKELNPFFSQLTLRWIQKLLNQNSNHQLSSGWNHPLSPMKRIWILVNKKWYANWVICQDCGHIPQCKRCSVSINYHKLSSWEFMWLCHICKTQYNLPTICPECWSKKIKDFGLGTQKVAEFIKNEFGKESIIIESQTVNSPSKIKKINEEIKSKNPDILIWTSLLTTPLKDFHLDLIIYLNADLGLNIPDYTSSEKNFYFLYEWITKHQNCNFIVQTFNPSNYSIRKACKMNEQEFREEENKFREKHNYPPFSEICIILYKNEIEKRLFTKVDKLNKELLYLREKYMMKDLEIYTTPPLIYKMFGKYRYNIVLKWNNLRNFMDIVYTKLNLASKWFKINRMADTII
jgi:primosomal protein N' (replication factor Y) (superfamily II helicase)